MFAFVLPPVRPQIKRRNFVGHSRRLNGHKWQGFSRQNTSSRQFSMFTLLTRPMTAARLDHRINLFFL